ncbi:MAG: site-specific integrase [Candidatus Ozemobacteraceae bacterium]
MKTTQSGNRLKTAINRYLELMRSLGRGYLGEERILMSLLRFIEDAGSVELDLNTFEGWEKNFANLSANTRRYRLGIIRKFCVYRSRTEPTCFVPDKYRFPRSCPPVSPVIFGSEAVARMLIAAGKMQPTPVSPFLPAVMRFAVVLLYTAGLRRGELLRLCLADADAAKGLLRIRESKFHKSRFVPLSRDACQELRHYLKQRMAPPLPAAPSSPLLCHRKGGLRAYTGQGLSYGIKKLFQIADVQSPDGRRPRVQDFRYPNLNKIQTFSY